MPKRGPRAAVAAAVPLAVLLLIVPTSAVAASPRVDLAGSSAALPPGALPLGVLRSDALSAAGAVGVAADPGTMLHLTVTLRGSDTAGLGAMLNSLSDPRSPDYRHFLTHQESLERFAPRESSVRAVSLYFEEGGAKDLVLSPDGFSLSLDVSARQVMRLFGLPVERVGTPGATGLVAVGTPTLPPTVQALVASVSGLSQPGGRADHSSVAPAERLRPAQWVIDGVGAQEPWFFGSDFASAYHVSSLWPGPSSVANSSYPNGTAVATLLMSGYNATSDRDLPPFDPVAVDSYFNDTFAPGWPHPSLSGVAVPVQGVTPPAPGYFGGQNDSTANSVENSLDLEMAGSAAPGSDLVNFYFGGSLLASPRFTLSDPSVADAFGELLTAALAHDYNGSRLVAISGSFGTAELNDTLWNTELSIAQLMGVTVLAASGDQGNAPDAASGRSQGPGATWPASAAFDSFGTVAVGGSSVVLDGVPTSTFNSSGNLTGAFDPTVTQVASQSVWYDTLGGFGNLSGSDGGASTVYPEPGWQLVSAAQPTVVNATVLQGVRSLGRTTPDVAFPANTTVAYVARDASGVYFEVLQGTSISAPFLAGMLASASHVVGHPFGFLDPELYRIGSYYAAHPGDPTNPYLDVQNGGNYLFSAGPEWDAVTGWGGLDAVGFLAADANASVRDYQYLGPTPGLPHLPSITGGTLTEYLLLLLGVGIASAAVVVIWRGRPKAPRAPPYGSYGAQNWTPQPPASGSPGPLPPGPEPPPPWAPGALGPPMPPGVTLMACPYCGAPRPAEPTRCPSCGRL